MRTPLGRKCLAWNDLRLDGSFPAAFVLKRIGFYPAGASAPFAATLVDVTGLVIYFIVAIVML